MNKDFVVRVNIPEGVSIKEMRDYIDEAVRAWSGGYHPDHPLFGYFHGKKRLYVRPAANIAPPIDET